VALRSAFDAAFVAKVATGHVLGGGAVRRMRGGIAGEGAWWQGSEKDEVLPAANLQLVSVYGPNTMEIRN
jgi:hypothetical protein